MLIDTDASVYSRFDGSCLLSGWKKQTAKNGVFVCVLAASESQVYGKDGHRELSLPVVWGGWGESRWAARGGGFAPPLRFF